jgi:hypothetical protein
VGVVGDLSARHRATELGCDLTELEAGDVGGEMVGVGADVAQHQGRPALRRREAPVGRRIAIGFGRGGEVALDVLDVELADGAERAGPHHGPGVAHHRIAGVIVCGAEH